MDQWEERMTRRPDPEPRLELLETCWRMRAPSGRILSCGVYQTAIGLEVRVGYSEEDLLYSKRAIDREDAAAICEELRRTVVAKGGFTELAD
jgi:hypothetical protein